MKREHNRKLVIGYAYLVKVPLPRKAQQIMDDVGDWVESQVIETGYLDTAPFEWITLMIRLGAEDEPEVHIDPISKMYGDLPLAIQIAGRELMDLTMPELYSRLEDAAIKALVGAGRRYSLKVELKKQRVTP